MSLNENFNKAVDNYNALDKTKPTNLELGEVYNLLKRANERWPTPDEERAESSKESSKESVIIFDDKEYVIPYIERASWDSKKNMRKRCYEAKIAFIAKSAELVAKYSGLEIAK